MGQICVGRERLGGGFLATRQIDDAECRREDASTSVKASANESIWCSVDAAMI